MTTRKPRRKRKPLRARKKLLRGKRLRTKRKRRGPIRHVKLRRKGRRAKSVITRRRRKTKPLRRKVRRPAPLKKRRAKKRRAKLSGTLMPSKGQYRTNFRRFIREPGKKKRRTFAIIEFALPVTSGGAPAGTMRAIPFALGYLTRKQLQRKYPDDMATLLAFNAARPNVDIESARVLGYGALIEPKLRRGMRVYKRARKGDK